MRGTAAALIVLVGLLAGAAAEEAPPPEVTAALEQIKDEKTIELSTVGRKTGKRHTRPVWFVVDGGRIVVQAGKDGKTDWYRNLEKNPVVGLRQGEYTFRAKSTLVTDAAEIERIHGLFTDKYTVAWLGSFVGAGIGRGRPVVLTPDAVSVRR